MSKKRRNRRYTEQVNEVSTRYNNNVIAFTQGPQQKKTWSRHDITQIQPKTSNQSKLFNYYDSNFNICAYGSAGTGKTFQLLALAINDIVSGTCTQNHVTIVRSTVATRDLGFLPGTIEEKYEPYEMPYIDIMAELCGRQSTYADMKDRGLIKFVSTSFIRGTTWNDSIIIVDEMQNMTAHEIHSVMTRVGENSRILVTGDLRQTDLDGGRNGTTGMARFLQVADSMKNFACINFTRDDIVRSDFVKQWIIANELYDDNN